MNKEMIKEVIKNAVERKFGGIDKLVIYFQEIKDENVIFNTTAIFNRETVELDALQLVVDTSKINESSDLEDFFNEFKKELVKQKEDFNKHWVEIYQEM